MASGFAALLANEKAKMCSNKEAAERTTPKRTRSPLIRLFSSAKNGKNIQNLLGCWVVGMLGCWVIGLLDCWRVGLLACSLVGLLACWVGGLLGC